VLTGAMKFRIRELRKQRRLTLVELAEKAGISRSYLNELELGAKTINAARLEQVARALDVPVEDLFVLTPGHVAVPGRAGAGARVYLVDDHAKGEGLYQVECPPQLPARGIVAVEVSGDSMEPVYSEGDLLFYSRDVMGVPDEAVGRKCVCEDDEGRIWVKQVKADSEPGLFRLLSINPAGDNMFGVRLKWAAPVRLHLPAEFVRKV